MLGFLSGLLIVRSLEKSDYGYYSIVISIIAASALVAESGVNSALMSRGSKRLNIDTRLKALFRDGEAFRLRIIWPTVLIAMLLSGGLLLINKSSLSAAFSMSLISLFTIVAIAGTTTYQTWHRLHLNASRLRNVPALTSLLRLLALGIVIYLFGLNGIIALLIGLFFALFALAGYRRGVSFSKVGFEHGRLGNERAFRTLARRTIPMTAALVLSEQLVVLLLSIFAGPEIIAEVTALARFAIAFTVLNMLVADIAAGRLARAGNLRRLILRQYSLTMGAYLAIVIAMIGFVAVFATELLWLLGAQYSGLESELVVVTSGAAILNLAYSMGYLNQARGWLRHSWILIPLAISWCVVGVNILPLNTTLGGALFVAGNAIPSILTQLVRLISGVSRLKR